MQVHGNGFVTRRGLNFLTTCVAWGSHLGSLCLHGWSPGSDARCEESDTRLSALADDATRTQHLREIEKYRALRGPRWRAVRSHLPRFFHKQRAIMARDAPAARRHEDLQVARLEVPEAGPNGFFVGDVARRTSGLGVCRRWVSVPGGDAGGPSGRPDARGSRLQAWPTALDRARCSVVVLGVSILKRETESGRAAMRARHRDRCVPATRWSSSATPSGCGDAPSTAPASTLVACGDRSPLGGRRLGPKRARGEGRAFGAHRLREILRRTCRGHPREPGDARGHSACSPAVAGLRREAPPSRRDTSGVYLVSTCVYWFPRERADGHPQRGPCRLRAVDGSRA